MTIYNCTPHNLSIYAECDTEYIPKLRKAFVLPDALPLVEIPPSGYVLSAHFTMRKSTLELYFDGKLLPLARQIVESIDQPTDLFSNFDPSMDWLIVSALYADAVRQLSQTHPRILQTLLCVNNVVYSNPSKPAPIGCLGLTLK
jgi:hypothetical protein